MITNANRFPFNRNDHTTKEPMIQEIKDGGNKILYVGGFRHKTREVTRVTRDSHLLWFTILTFSSAFSLVFQ